MTTHKHATTTTNTTDLTTLANDAVATLKDLTSKLPIDDTLPPEIVNTARVANRVPVEVMSLASTVLNENPEQYPQFDAAGAKAAVEYEQAMGAVAASAQVLTERLQKSVLKRKSAMAKQALALYAVMKGTTRLTASDQTRGQVKTMSKLLTTHRKSRATSVTQSETAAANKAMRAQKQAKVAEASVNDASNKSAYANAHAALQVAASAGSLPLPLSAAPLTNAAPAAPSPDAPPPGTAATPPAVAVPTVTPSH